MNMHNPHHTTYSTLSSLPEWPFLVCQGTEDHVTNPKGVEYLYEKAKSNDKTLKWLPGWWHALLEEPNKEELFGIATKWMLDRAVN